MFLLELLHKLYCLRQKGFRAKVAGWWLLKPLLRSLIKSFIGICHMLSYGSIKKISG